MKKLYVGNLSYETTNEHLIELFSKFGEVNSANIICDKFDNSSKGFGFVEMMNANEADQAIDELDGSELDGRQIKVNEARPKEEGGGRRQGGGGFRGGRGGGGRGRNGGGGFRGGRGSGGGRGGRGGRGGGNSW